MTIKIQIKYATSNFEGPKAKRYNTQGSSEKNKIAEEAGNDYSDDDDDNDKHTIKNTTKEDNGTDYTILSILKNKLFNKPVHHSSPAVNVVQEVGRDYSDNDDDEPAIKTTTKDKTKLQNNTTDLQGQKTHMDEVSGKKGDDYVIGGLIHKLKNKLFHKPAYNPAPVVNVHQEVGRDYSDDDDEEPAVETTTKNHNNMENIKTDVKGQKTNKKEMTGEDGDDYTLGLLAKKKLIGGLLHHKIGHLKHNLIGKVALNKGAQHSASENSVQL